MSDPISSIGSPGLGPPAAAYVAAQAETTQASSKTAPNAATGAASTVATAVQQKASQEATNLDLSPSAGMSSDQASPAMTMEEAAQAFQNYLQSLPSNLQFQPDSEAGIVVFRVVNPVTNKVIRQLPSEEVVQQARYLRMAEQQAHSGILLDKSL